MLNSVHVVASAAIVVSIPNPFISLPLAFASHILLDSVPHWNWSPGKTLLGKIASVLDGILAFTIVGISYWFLNQNWVIIAAGVLAMLPDIIQAPYHFWGWQPKWLVKFINWERTRQKWAWMKPWMGIATQVAVVIISLIILKIV